MTIVGFGTGGSLPSREYFAKQLARTWTADWKPGAGIDFRDLDIRPQALKHSWPAINQFDRPTCTAFATSACMEVRAAKTGEAVRLSPDHLYGVMRAKGPGLDRPAEWSNGATKLSHARLAIEAKGICKEADVPYRRNGGLDIKTLANAIRKDALTRRVPLEGLHHSDDQTNLSEDETARRILDELDLGRPVAVAMTMLRFEGDAGDNWRNPETFASGIVYGPREGAYGDRNFEPVSAHIVCVIGFQVDPKASGGGWFIFKNSWGSSFGKFPRDAGNAPLIPEPGFGAISLGHVEMAAHECLAVSVD
jgi:Papain family cysteine protease